MIFQSTLLKKLAEQPKFNKLKGKKKYLRKIEASVLSPSKLIYVIWIYSIYLQSQNYVNIILNQNLKNAIDSESFKELFPAKISHVSSRDQKI